MLPLAIFRFASLDGPGHFATWAAARDLPTTLIALDQAGTVPDDASAFSGIVMMGGPMSVNDALPWISPLCGLIRDAIGDGVPVLGHCLGGQLMAKALGATVARTPDPEIGWLHVDACEAQSRREWFGGAPRFAAFHWHYDAFELPPMGTQVLTSAATPNQAFIIDDRHIGLQCHIEMTRELVESWCAAAADELPPRSSAHMQSAADILSDLPARVAALNHAADGIYNRWAKGLRR
jgi:GMP synthase-like glutamine amidotransferase